MLDVGEGAEIVRSTMDNLPQAETSVEEKLTDTYNNAVVATQEMDQAHTNGLKAVWERAVAEVNKLRDEAGSAVAGVDIAALQAENAALKAEALKNQQPVEAPK